MKQVTDKFFMYSNYKTCNQVSITTPQKAQGGVSFIFSPGGQNYVTELNF